MTGPGKVSLYFLGMNLGDPLDDSDHYTPEDFNEGALVPYPMASLLRMTMNPNAHFLGTIDLQVGRVERVVPDFLPIPRRP